MFSKLSLTLARRKTFNEISKALGQGMTRLSIIRSIIIVLLSFFYVYTISSFLSATVYLLYNRVIYERFFDTYIFNRNIDHLIILVLTFLWLLLSSRSITQFIVSGIYGGIIVIALIYSFRAILDIVIILSFPLVVALSIYDSYSSKTGKIYSYLARNYFAILGIIVAMAAIAVSLIHIFLSLPYELESQYLRNYAYEIFSIFSSISSVLIVLLVLSFPVKIVTDELLLRKIKFKNDKFVSLLRAESLKNRTRRVYIIIFITLSVIMVVIPHLPAVNKDNRDVGVDTHYYVDWINTLTQSDNFTEFFRQAFSIIQQGDRPLTLILLYAIVKIINVNPLLIVDYVPLILAPAHVLVMYLLTRELTSKNEPVALTAAFLTALSFQTLVGIYAGFYANWLAIIIGYLSFVFLFRFLKTPNNSDLVVYSTLLTLVLFSHVYTWTILVIVTTIFLLVILKLGYYRRRVLMILLMIISVTVTMDVVKNLATGSRTGFERDVQVSISAGSFLEQFELRWGNLIDTLTKYAGQFSNFIILMLGVFWIFFANLREKSTIFLMSFLSLGILPLFFGNWVIQSRVFYDIPFQIPAAIALVYLKKQENGNLLFLPICLLLIAVSIRAVSNFYYVAPLT